MNGVERNILLRRSFAVALLCSLRWNFRVGSKSARRDESDAKEVQTKKKHLRKNVDELRVPSRGRQLRKTRYY